MADELLSKLPAPRPVRAGGQQLAVRVLGEGHGPRLMLFHGGPGLDHHLVLPLGVALAENFEVWLPDLPGHGRSHDDERGLPDLSRVVEVTAHWLAAVDDVAILAGHSLGAWLARELVSLGYLVPQAAVLIAPPAASPGEPAPRVRGLAGRRSVSASRSEDRALRAELLEFVGSDSGRRASPLFAASIARAIVRAPRRYGGLHAQLGRVLSREPPPCPTRCPTLIVGGALDRVAPPQACAALAAVTPGATVETIDEQGHFPFVDDAEPLANRIEAFVSRSVGGS